MTKNYAVAAAAARTSRRNEVADGLGQQSWAGRILKGEDLAKLGQIPAADVLAVDMAKSQGSNCNGIPGLTAMAVRFAENEDAVRRDCGNARRAWPA